jgi:lipid-binding SYLF domain-containing protein
MLRFQLKATMGILLAGWMLAGAAAAHANETQLVSEANRTKALFLKTDPGLSAFFARSAGYVVFPSVLKGGYGVGASHGRGVLFENDRAIGKATVSQVTVGAQIGGQEYAEVIFFETPADVASFMKNDVTLSAQVSAVALKSGASANAKYREGVAVFTVPRGGLMVEATVGGQKFTYEPFAARR